MISSQPNPDPYYQSVTPHKDIVLEKNSSPSKEQVQQIVKCFLHEVGKGSFGVVYKILDGKFNSVFKVGKNSDESLQEFLREAEAYKKIAKNRVSKHLTHGISFFAWDKCPILQISSSVVCLNLREYFNENSCSQLHARTLLSHTLEGLKCLHDVCRIIHGDINPGNILAYMNGPKPSEKDQFVITDFGNWSELHEEKADLGVVNFRHPAVNLGQLASYPQNDLWAIGVTVCACITKRFLLEIPKKHYGECNTSELPSKEIQKKLFQYIRKRFPNEKKKELDKLIPKNFREDKDFMSSLEEGKSNI